MARKTERIVEVLNPEVLRTEGALRVLARIAVRYAFENHLFDDSLINQAEKEKKDRKKKHNE